MEPIASPVLCMRVTEAPPQPEVWLAVGHVCRPAAILKDFVVAGVFIDKHDHGCLVVANELDEIVVLKWLVSHSS